MTALRTLHASGETRLVPLLATDETTSSFAAVSAPLRQSMQDRGFSSLTAIQEAVAAVEDPLRDLRLASQTGSGKTVAIGVALAKRYFSDPAEAPDGESAEPDSDRHNKPEETSEPATKQRAAQSYDYDSPRRKSAAPKALIIAPTRELATQVATELRWLFENTDFRVLSVTGGTDPHRERQQLRRGVDILVGTPGRLLDHLRAKALRLESLSDIILDEADQLLDMGFKDELDAIIEELPENRRSILVSATFPRAVQGLARRLQHDPFCIDIAGQSSGTNEGVEHQALLVPDHQRYPALVNVLLANFGQRALVFVARRDQSTDLAERLASEGLAALPFSGDLNQNQRTRTLSAFRSDAVQVLVATDVAARGIDVAGIGLVVHYEMPHDSAVYVHRSGRTGRAGATGKSILLVSPRAQRRAHSLLDRARVEASWPSIPTAAQLQKALVKQCRRDVYKNTAEDGIELDEAKLEYAGDLLSKIDPKRLVAVLIEMSTPRYPCEPKTIDRTSPARKKKRPENQSFTPFVVNWGERDGATKSRLLAQICRWGEIQSGHIGAIRIGDKNSLIEVENRQVEHFEANTAKPDFKQPKLRMQRARPEQVETLSEQDAQHRMRRPRRRMGGFSSARSRREDGQGEGRYQGRSRGEGHERHSHSRGDRNDRGGDREDRDTRGSGRDWGEREDRGGSRGDSRGGSRGPRGRGFRPGKERGGGRPFRRSK